MHGTGGRPSAGVREEDPMTRRQWITAAGATAAAYPWGRLGAQTASTGGAGMPGPYRGKVVAIEHPSAVEAGIHNQAAVRQMFDAGMRRLTGAPTAREAWARFVTPDDRVGIKLNASSHPSAVSSVFVLDEILRGVRDAGVPVSRIVVYDRYRADFESAGMPSWLPPGVLASHASEEWDPRQTDIRGYDPAVFAELPYVRDAKPTDKTARRSFAARFITSEVTKLINVAVLKDHQAAGVTLALKNMSHGLVNNVARSHPDNTTTRYDTFVPAVLALKPIREKAALHIVDGVRGLYHSGPHPQPQFFWDHKTLYFATDPVAVDRVCWDVIDRKRISRGMAPVAEARPDRFSTWEVRQPQYILAAGAAGFGESDLTRIDLQRQLLEG
jgi:hypothetical protein